MSSRSRTRSATAHLRPVSALGPDAADRGTLSRAGRMLDHQRTRRAERGRADVAVSPPPPVTLELLRVVSTLGRSLGPGLDRLHGTALAIRAVLGIGRAVGDRVGLGGLSGGV